MPGRATATTTKRRGLDRSIVVATALDLLDEQGVDGFSMTRLGDRLGVTAMALYRHVSDRADLERAVVELALGELASPSAAVDDWEAGVATWMHLVRQCWTAHPWVGGMLGTRAELSPPWLVAVDRLAEILGNAGFTPTAVARELVQISRTTVGVLWQEVNAPLPQSGLNKAAFDHLPASARRRWQPLTKALRRYDNTALFDDLVAGTLDRLRAAR